MTAELIPSEAEEVLGREDGLTTEAVSRGVGTTVVPLRSWIAVLGASLGAFMAMLETEVVNAALADVRGAVGANIDDGSWISTAYPIGEIVAIPLTGWLSRAFSTRLYLITNAALFVAFSIACGSVRELDQLVVLRALQGLSGGVMVPMAFTLIITLLPEARRPAGIALFSFTLTVSSSIGPLLGGWLTATWGWPSIFYFTVVPGAVTIGMLWASLDREPMQLRLLGQGDWWGILTMALGLASLQIVLEEGERKDWFESGFIVRLAATAAIALALFVWIELGVKGPLINLRLLARRSFLAGAMGMFLLGVAIYGSEYMLLLYLAGVQDYSPAQIGRVLVWAALPQLLVFPLLPLLMRKLDPRWLLVVGFALFTASNLMNVGITADVAAAELVAPNLARGVGQALLLVPLSVLAVAGIETSQAASASALLTIMHNLGSAVGIASLESFLIRREQLHFYRLSEEVSVFEQDTRQRLDQLVQYFLGHGATDSTLAWREAVLAVGQAVQQQANVMAFADTFYVLGAIMLVGLATTVLFRRPASSEAAKAATAH
ncbi:MAG: DHA2 family efflux MFS transporter permease subunit [Alphaproteobacteria bacterium]|nr:DHA2 family efflux MFS transporter permease subunit [Alphaproteobacteria bacterium]